MLLRQTDFRFSFPWLTFVCLRTHARVRARTHCSALVKLLPKELAALVTWSQSVCKYHFVFLRDGWSLLFTVEFNKGRLIRPEANLNSSTQQSLCLSFFFSLWCIPCACLSVPVSCYIQSLQYWNILQRTQVVLDFGPQTKSWSCILSMTLHDWFFLTSR